MIVDKWSGQDAANLRAALRWPITKFAGDLGIAEGTVSKWERLLGAIEPSPLLQAVLDDVLRAASPDVQDRFVLLSCRSLEGSGDSVADLNRRELLRLLSLAAPAVAFPGDPKGRPDDALGQVLGDYRDTAARLWRIYSQAVPKAAALPFVNAQLRIVTARLRDVGPARQRLCALASELFQLAGEILFDQNRYGDAAHCYTIAATAAQEAHAADLWACAMTRHSFLYVYGQDYRPALPLLEYADDIARGGNHQLSTRQWVSVVKAHAHAGLGELAAAQRALAAADEVQALGPGMQNGGWLRFTGDRLPEEKGSCYARLGRPDLAAASLETALSGPLSSRRRGSVYTDLAATGLQRQDVDEFASYAQAALDVAEQSRSGYVARRLRALQAHAGPFLGEPIVRDICDQIAALSTDQAA